MTDRFFFPLASGLILIIFVLANTLIQPLLSGARIDFTENAQFTLSKGTASTLKNLSEPIELTLVYTRGVGQDYPAVRAYAQRVRELLESYESTGGANLRLVEIDPTPFSLDEDEALAAGITAVETDGTDPLYFGLIGKNAVDDELVIPFLAPERESTLEYDLTRLVARLDDPEPNTIGVITDLSNMKGDGVSGGYYVLREMAALYNIIPIAEDFTSIPEDVDMLFLAHATNLSESQTYLVDQFILEKGRALILVDPASTISQAGGVFNTGAQRAASDLGALGEAWGVALYDDAVADTGNALTITTNQNGRLIETPQPIFIGIPKSGMAPGDTITAPLSLNINLGAPGALKVQPNAEIEVTPLLLTSQAPSFIPAGLVLGGAPPQEVLKAYSSQSGSLMLAARLSGQLQTAFTSGPPIGDLADPVAAELARLAGETAGPHRAASLTPAEIIILADTDMLDDAFYLDPRSGTARAENATFIMNALDNLTGGTDLLDLRSRTPNLRPMVRVDDMRERAQNEFYDEQARLEGRLAQAQGRLEELQAIGATGGFFSGDLDADLTPEERAELSELRQSVIETRERLREIERDFRREIDGLENTLRFVNIWGGSIIIVLIGFFIWVRKKRLLT